MYSRKISLLYFERVYGVELNGLNCDYLEIRSSHSTLPQTAKAHLCYREYGYFSEYIRIYIEKPLAGCSHMYNIRIMLPFEETHIYIYYLIYIHTFCMLRHAT